jgi:hypothetical protein
MTTEKKLLVVVFRTRFSDWATSIANLLLIVGVSIANHRWGGGSSWIDALAVVLGFMLLLAITWRKTETNWRGTIDEAIEHLKQMKDTSPNREENR